MLAARGINSNGRLFPSFNRRLLPALSGIDGDMFPSVYCWLLTGPGRAGGRHLPGTTLAVHLRSKGPFGADSGCFDAGLIAGRWENAGLFARRIGAGCARNHWMLSGGA
jgi:hypothetical protein